MVLFLLAVGLSRLAPPTPAIPLTRAFKPGQRMSYSVRASLQVQQRQMGLQTFIPEDLDFNYDFTLDVKDVNKDGIASVRYNRPKITEIEGETVDSGPKTRVENVKQDLMLKISPLNEILDMKDLTAEKPKGKPGSFRQLRWTGETASQGLGELIGPFVGEVQRLALFIGPFDTSLDIAPRMPVEEVSVGDTWKRTVGYQPQKVRGKEGQQAVQRLDYTYTFKGDDLWNGKPVKRVEAVLKLDTDLAAFFNQLFGAKPEQTGLKSIPLKLDATIQFYLDPTTLNTLAAVGRSSGGFSIMLTANPNEPLQEMLLSGRSNLKLVGTGPIPATTPKKAGAG